MIRLQVDSADVQPGDTFVTPATRHPYRVLSISNFVHHEIRGYERIAQCVWTDTNIAFQGHFKQGKFWTIREEKESS